MILAKLVLQNFRSYGKKTFEFSPDVTLITGPNTSGKTNLLEAVYLLATGKSFRADRENEMISWRENVGRVIAEVGQPSARVSSRSLADSGPFGAGLAGRLLSPQSRPEETKLEAVLTTGEVIGQKAPLKKYLVNGVPRRQIDFVGNLRVVLFWPEDLELVTDSPSLRRRYLDSVLVQVDREYRRNIYSYERGLRQRNRLLDLIGEGKAHRHQLTFWDQLLIKAGAYITDKRQEYIDYVNKRSFLLGASQFALTYDRSVISEARLLQYKDEEVAVGATLVGPHRDDFILEKSVKRKASGKTEDKPLADCGGRGEPRKSLDLSIYGSRGEQRLAVLWLKLAELDFIESKTEERPVLLLDDIFSELDEEHRELVTEVVDKQQTIMTATDESLVPKAKFKQMHVIRL